MENGVEFTIRIVEKRMVYADSESDFERNVEEIRESLQPNQQVLVAKKIVGCVIVSEVDEGNGFSTFPINREAILAMQSTPEVN